MTPSYVSTGGSGVPLGVLGLKGAPRSGQVVSRLEPSLASRLPRVCRPCPWLQSPLSGSGPVLTPVPVRADAAPLSPGAAWRIPGHWTEQERGDWDGEWRFSWLINHLSCQQGGFNQPAWSHQCPGHLSSVGSRGWRGAERAFLSLRRAVAGSPGAGFDGTESSTAPPARAAARHQWFRLTLRPGAQRGGLAGRSGLDSKVSERRPGLLARAQPPPGPPQLLAGAVQRAEVQDSAPRAEPDLPAARWEGCRPARPHAGSGCPQPQHAACSTQPPSVLGGWEGAACPAWLLPHVALLGAVLAPGWLCHLLAGLLGPLSPPL